MTATDPGGLSAQHLFTVTVPNRAPAVVGSMNARTMVVGQKATIGLSPYFSDPDGDALTYAVTTSDPAVASVTASDDVLTVTARVRATVTVIVTATDPGGMSAQHLFTVTIPNLAPYVVVDIPQQTIAVTAQKTWTTATLFTDPEGDALTYAASSTDRTVVRAWVADVDLRIDGIAQGFATVTIIAIDTYGARAHLFIDVTVGN